VTGETARRCVNVRRAARCSPCVALVLYCASPSELAHRAQPDPAPGGHAPGGRLESRYFNTPLRLQGSFKVAYDLTAGVLDFLRTLAYALTRFARRGARTSHLFSLKRILWQI
jgi:hypothetical protein